MAEAASVVMPARVVARAVRGVSLVVLGARRAAGRAAARVGLAAATAARDDRWVAGRAEA